jgi:hypothetical protein
VTAAVNTHYQLTISGLTADRHLILPSGASAGDVISWELMSDAPADYELILKGDTGVTVTLRNESFTAAEVTRYFIEGETGRAVFDGSEWRINRANDGRIACEASAVLTTPADGEPYSTFVTPTAYGGAWTTNTNLGGCFNALNSRFTLRRAAIATGFVSSCYSKDAFSNNVFSVGFWALPDDVYFLGGSYGRSYVSASAQHKLLTGGYFEMRYAGGAGGIGLSINSEISFKEIL